jgi:HK97 family phage portal protein
LNGFIKVQGRLNDKQLNDIQNQWNRDNNSIKILQGNMEFVPLTVDPDDTQLLESRNFNILDIARFFGVPASKLNQKEGATYNGIESENIAFLSDTIQPLIEKIEDEFELKLLSEYERINYEIKFDISKLLRTDLKAQSEYYRTLFNIGIFSQNEIRKQLDMNNI